MSSTTAKPTAGVSSLPTFALERYFAKYEFSAPYIAVSTRSTASLAHKDGGLTIQ
jgi:hypothetical protein